MEQKYPFQKMNLPYAYNGLEPYIDMRTVMIHHDKHYGKYVDELNSYLEMKPQLQNCSLEELIVKYSDNLNIRHNVGGVYNHQFYFNGMRPGSSQIVIGLNGRLMQCIIRDFGSVEALKSHFIDTAVNEFGSGYAWLCCDAKGKLIVITTDNQDTPLTLNLKPLLCIDVWEHSYYLKHQNVRADYVNAFWNLIDWVKVSDRLGL